MVKLDDSSDKIAEMTLRLLEAQAFSTVLQSQLSQSASEAEAIGLGLREELRQTAAKLHDANSKLVTLKADAEAREQEFNVTKQALEEQIEKLVGTVSEMEQEREAIESETRETVLRLQGELDALKRETSLALAELEKERAALKDEMSSTQIELAELLHALELAKSKDDKSEELEAALEQLRAVDQQVAVNFPLANKQSFSSSVHAAFDLLSDQIFDLIESLERGLNKPISRSLSNERQPLEASLAYLKRLQAELANRLLENEDRVHELKARLDAQTDQTAAANEIAKRLEDTASQQATENVRLGLQLARQSNLLAVAQSALAASQNEQRRLAIELELSVKRAASTPPNPAPADTGKQQLKQRQFDALQVQLKQAELRSSIYTSQINELQTSLSNALDDIAAQRREIESLASKVAPPPTRPSADDLASKKRLAELEAALAEAQAQLQSVPWGTVEKFRRLQRLLPSRVQSWLSRRGKQ